HRLLYKTAPCSHQCGPATKSGSSYLAFAVIIMMSGISARIELFEHSCGEDTGDLTMLRKCELVDVCGEPLGGCHGALHPSDEIGDDAGCDLDLPVAKMFHEKRRQMLLVRRLDRCRGV